MNKVYCILKQYENGVYEVFNSKESAEAYAYNMNLTEMYSDEENGDYYVEEYNISDDEVKRKIGMNYVYITGNINTDSKKITIEDKRIIINKELKEYVSVYTFVSNIETYATFNSILLESKYNEMTELDLYDTIYKEFIITKNEQEERECARNSERENMRKLVSEEYNNIVNPKERTSMASDSYEKILADTSGKIYIPTIK